VILGSMVAVLRGACCSRFRSHLSGCWPARRCNGCAWGWCRCDRDRPQGVADAPVRVGDRAAGGDHTRRIGVGYPAGVIVQYFGVPAVF
jgi:hypothetical protein